MFSVNVWNSHLKCCHHTPTRGDCSVMSSRTSDQLLRRPDGRTCWDGDAAPRADDDWRNVSDGHAVVHQVQGSSASQTPTNCQTEHELNSIGNVEPLQVVVVPSHCRTSECRWRDVLQRSAHAGVCLWCTSALRLEQHCSSARVT